MKRDYLSRAVRELHPPVTAIYGFAETLLRQKPDETVWREFLAIISSNAAQLSSVMRDLADLALLESRGGREFLFAPTDLCSLLQEVAAVHGASEQRVGPELRLPKRPLFILADRNKVMQAITRVLTQAVCCPEAAVKLRIFVEAPAGSVANAGRSRMIGVSIVERCARANRGADGRRPPPTQAGKGGPGMGLGMIVVEKIIGYHGGKLLFRRRGARGSSIVMLFPEVVKAKQPGGGRAGRAKPRRIAAGARSDGAPRGAARHAKPVAA